jgi:hypothetical protein
LGAWKSLFGNYLPWHHNPPRVKLRRQSKNLSELGELDVKPSAISNPHKDSLFLVKEELSYDLLVLVVEELQQVGDAMKVTSF